MSVEPHAILQPGPDVVFRELEGEAVILHLGTATYFGLDEVGTRVWQLLAEGLAVQEVCRALSDEFDAPPEQIRQDVSALVDELLQKDLVRAIR
jgi:hypothetical protein